MPISRICFVAVACLMVVTVNASANRTCEQVVVKHVVDGDTIRLNDGRWVRLASIDTPEIDHQNRRAEPFAYTARDFLHNLVMDRPICLSLAPEPKDAYGRVVGYLFDAQGKMINAEILSQGLGYVYPHGNNTKAHFQALLNNQRRAMRQRLGIWLLGSDDRLPLTGNRRSKRFHRITCPRAKRISPKNRRRFHRTWDAFWAGYAPAKGCLGLTIKKGPTHP